MADPPLAISGVLVLPQASAGPLGSAQQVVEGALLVLKGVLPRWQHNTTHHITSRGRKYYEMLANEDNSFIHPLMQSPARSFLCFLHERVALRPGLP